MGGKHSVFDEEQIKLYEECTFLTSKEILHLYKTFCCINPKKIDIKKADVLSRVSFTEVQRLPELKHNPFSEQICEVFSTSGDGMNFEDFLDMCSVFSEEAPWELKASYAFKIFDFNKDAFICANNLEKLLAIITGDGLSNEEITDIVERVMNEADIGQNGKLAYPEFEHVISRAPDFINLFRMSV